MPLFRKCRLLSSSLLPEMRTRLLHWSVLVLSFQALPCFVPLLAHYNLLSCPLATCSSCRHNQPLVLCAVLAATAALSLLAKRCWLTFSVVLAAQ